MRADVCRLYSVKPISHAASLVNTFPNCNAALGIREIDKDGFVMLTGTISLQQSSVTPGSFVAWLVDYSSYQSPSDTPKISRICFPRRPYNLDSRNRPRNRRFPRLALGIQHPHGRVQHRGPRSHPGTSSRRSHQASKFFRTARRVTSITRTRTRKSSAACPCPPIRFPWLSVPHKRWRAAFVRMILDLRRTGRHTLCVRVDT